MNNVHPTTRNTPVRSAYSTLFSTDTSFSSIRLSCHVISLPTCTIGADRPTRNNRNGSHRGGRRIRLGSPAVCKRSCIKLNPGTRPCCQISQATYGINPSIYSTSTGINLYYLTHLNLYNFSEQNNRYDVLNQTNLTTKRHRLSNPYQIR